MTHFAYVENGIVTKVLVIEQDMVDTGLFGDPSKFVKTDYHTAGNVHAKGNEPLRGNYAGVGQIYDAELDVFYPQQPYPSWKLNTTTYLWEAPIAKPVTDNHCFWNEEKQRWIEMSFDGFPITPDTE